jgi:putative inorganic carbon (hco3(-)) transporter
VHRLQVLLPILSHPDLYSALALVGLVAACLAASYLVSRVEVTILAVAAVLLEMFSSNWGLVGIPVPLDRVAFVVTLAALILKGARNVGTRRLVLRPVHLALLAAATWAAVSGIIAGTLTGSLGFYAFLDRFGLVPFIMFCLAPVLFGNPAQRRVLLGGLLVMALYLGLTGCLEGVHLYKLIFPRYIANPNVGIQFGRARGPFLESTGDGFCTFVGGVAATIGLRTWSGRWTRRACYLAMVLDLATLFLTLTRGVWIGAVVAIVAAMMLTKRTRRILIPAIVCTAVLVGGSLATIPSLKTEVLGRTEQLSPVWDRENTDLAAIRIIKEYPLTGVGWENFINVSVNFIRESPDIPITGTTIEIHNVFLSHAAELGLPGLLLWLLSLGSAIRRALLPRRFRRSARAAERQAEDPDLAFWRVGAFAMVLCFLVIADLAPFSEALPNTLLWGWLGIVASPYTSRPMAQALHRRALAPVAPTLAHPEDWAPRRPAYL